MSAPTVKTRFAPSPTGELHLGNLRTALFNALYARRHGGVFLLRIEDTDAARSRPEYTRALETELGWLGLDWQEGPGRDGGHGPYHQAARGAVYAGHYRHLEEGGQAYPCFCSDTELAAAREAQRAAGRPPRYPGTCARLTPAQVAERLAAGATPSLRFRVPAGRQVSFDDLVRGGQSFASDDIGDFIIRRGDGSPAFFFSNAVDDALMGVTHVLRGEDHLANTPRQLLLLEALGLPAPHYGHMAMIVAADGSPLSKRSGSASVRSLREAGYLPAAVCNHLARLGHPYAAEACLDLDGLAAEFDPARLARAPARHDESQLRHWQKAALAGLDDAQVWEWLGRGRTGPGSIAGRVPAGAGLDFVAAVRNNLVLPADGLIWAGNLYADGDRYDPDARDAVRAAGAAYFRTAVDLLADHGDDFSAYARALGAALGLKGRALYHPLRAALTGVVCGPEGEGQWQQGPELARVWNLLGTARLGRRLENAIMLCES